MATVLRISVLKERTQNNIKGEVMFYHEITNQYPGAAIIKKLLIGLVLFITIAGMAEQQVSGAVGTVGTVGTTPVVPAIPVEPTPTGDPTVTVPPTQQITPATETIQEIIKRVDAPPAIGVKKGTVRSVTVDTINTQNLKTIQRANVSIQQTAVVASTSVPIDTTASKPSQRVNQLKTQTFTAKKNTQNVVRNLQKLQKRCNHSYSLITKRCNICNKHKDSHYYDSTVVAMPRPGARTVPTPDKPEDLLGIGDQMRLFGTVTSVETKGVPPVLRISLTLIDNSGPGGTILTDANGNYSALIPRGFVGSIEATDPSRAFLTPESYPISQATIDLVNGQDFTAWLAPFGIPGPDFGIKETHLMYIGETYDFGAGPVPYPDAGNGPYTHYLDIVHPNATDNSNPFGSPGIPRRSIPQMLPAGSVVEVHNGPYTEDTGQDRIII